MSDADKNDPYTDMVSLHWIEQYLPESLRPYAYLMRLDRPIGTWLLLLPGLWAIFMSAGGFFSLGLDGLWVLILFCLGAVVMRGAGCVVNDILDKDFDAAVERTQNRPIPSGQVSVRAAMIFASLLFSLGLVILLQFNPLAVVFGFLSLFLILPYPLMKRYTWWPQLWLGLTFNWGVFLGWAAISGQMSLAAFLMYLAGIFWTLGYDTIYAHQDKEDDIMVGVKSSALKLGEKSKKYVAIFYGLCIFFLLWSGWQAELGFVYWAGIALAGTQLNWQIRDWDIDDQADCLEKFKSNRIFGLMVLGAIIIGSFFGF